MIAGFLFELNNIYDNGICPHFNRWPDYQTNLIILMVVQINQCSWWFHWIHAVFFAFRYWEWSLINDTKQIPTCSRCCWRFRKHMWASGPIRNSADSTCPFIERTRDCTASCMRADTWHMCASLSCAVFAALMRPICVVWRVLRSIFQHSRHIIIIIIVIIRARACIYCYSIDNKCILTIANTWSCHIVRIITLCQMC